MQGLIKPQSFQRALSPARPKAKISPVAVAEKIRTLPLMDKSIRLMWPWSDLRRSKFGIPPASLWPSVWSSREICNSEKWLPLHNHSTRMSLDGSVDVKNKSHGPVEAGRHKDHSSVRSTEASLYLPSMEKSLASTHLDTQHVERHPHQRQASERHRRHSEGAKPRLLVSNLTLTSASTQLDTEGLLFHEMASVIFVSRNSCLKIPRHWNCHVSQAREAWSRSLDRTGGEVSPCVFQRYGVQTASTRLHSATFLFERHRDVNERKHVLVSVSDKFKTSSVYSYFSVGQLFMLLRIRKDVRSKSSRHESRSTYSSRRSISLPKVTSAPHIWAWIMQSIHELQWESQQSTVRRR